MQQKTYKVSTYKHSSVEDWLAKMLLITFPWKDVLGISINGVNVRFGEIVDLLFAVLLLRRTWRFNKNEIKISLVLLLNLAVTLVGALLNSLNVNISFFTQYIIRNILNILFLAGFSASSIKYSEKDIDWLIRYFSIAQIVMLVLFYATHHTVYLLQIINYSQILKTGQVITIGGVTIPRFWGTTSEPGYLAPLLPIVTYYYLLMERPKSKTDKLFFALNIIETILTFSAAVYIFQIITLITYFTRKGKITLTKAVRAIFVIGIIIFAVIVINTNRNLYNTLNDLFLVKIRSFLTGNIGADYSSNERILNIRKAWKLFLSSSPVQFLIGHGTGGYLNYITYHPENLITNTSEEANNIYLSTLTDRGIIGLLIIFALFILIKKFRIKSNIYSSTIYLGIVLQFIDWMLVGNMWLCNFWQLVVLLIGIYRFETDKAIE